MRENIGFGEPQAAGDDEKIMEAAKLGGAYEIIKSLPEELDTYLVRPVQDLYSSVPPGTKVISGGSIDHTTVRKAGRLRDTANIQLSGGQIQRIIVSVLRLLFVRKPSNKGLCRSRTFMRTLNEDNCPGLLLFDEPRWQRFHQFITFYLITSSSASLDPEAEYGRHYNIIFQGVCKV